MSGTGGTPAGRVTPADKLAGVLPVVVSGGRPALKQRPTAGFLADLAGITADPVWVVREDEAPGYEADGHEIVTYPQEWAEEYAAAHWTGHVPFQPGGFAGAFPGREWACRVAAERGYWGAWQLDDNIYILRLITSYALSTYEINRYGGLGLFADILAAVALATNSAMTGGSLDSVSAEKDARRLARAGFPYSCFIERTGPGREPWYGPFEDDILHAYQYAAGPGPATAALVPALKYRKEHQQANGMRAAYANHLRSVGLQRAVPQIAKVSIRKTTSNGRGDPRVFHTMRPGAIATRTPLVVLDPDLYAAAARRIRGIVAEMIPLFREHVIDRADRWARRAERVSHAGV